MKRYFVSNGELKVHITEWGKERNPVIFCLHGLGGTSLSFIEVAELLKDEFRIISVDAPGHGKTPPFETTEEYEMPAMAEWINSIMNILKINKFYFLSHSWGSCVSLYYIHSFPEKVNGAILIDGGYQTKRLRGISVEEEVSHYLIDFEDYIDTWDQFLKEAVYGAVSRRSSLLNLAGEDLALEKDNKFYWHVRGITGAKIVKAMHKNETLDIYEELHLSNLVLLRATIPSEQNKYRDLTSNLFEQKTGGTVKLIPNATHMLHWDNPELVVDEIRRNWSLTL
ncbi:alpha/beta fold hydrolase [Bacillus salitolerans]|uniref:Alpha/beta fold hydrolase n=1 Tax=Bacillus salitolerans TaxID=1437434 RepID=A0ABW4LS98_9BACI